MIEVDEEKQRLKRLAAYLKEALETYTFKCFWGCSDPENVKVKDLAVPERKLHAALMSYLEGE